MGVRGELFTNEIYLDNRSYFFNVKETRTGDIFLQVVESKNRDGADQDRHQIAVFAEDMQKFLQGLEKSLSFIEKEQKNRAKIKAEKKAAKIEKAKKIYKILKQLAEVYRKIRNTIRYILGNTNDFNYETDAVPFNEMLELDQWALMHLQLLKKEVTAAYESYDFHVLYHAIHNFCTVEMSSFYLDILKDRLYAYKADSKERRSAQTAMHEILMDLIVMLSPVLSFTMEEVWQFMKKPANAPESVQMLPWPEVKEEYINEELETKWDNFIEIRSEITKVLELARRNKQIGHSLDAKVELHAEGEALAILKSVEKDLATLLIVSQAIIVEGAAEGAEATGREDLKVTVAAAEGHKCERCWIYSDEVGQDAEHPTLCKRCAEAVKD